MLEEFKDGRCSLEVAADTVLGFLSMFPTL